MGLLTGRQEASLVVDILPGGYTVTEADNENHWWSVSLRGAYAVIASHLGHEVDPHSSLGRRILAATRNPQVYR